MTSCRWSSGTGLAPVIQAVEIRVGLLQQQLEAVELVLVEAAQMRCRRSGPAAGPSPACRDARRGSSRRLRRAFAFGCLGHGLASASAAASPYSPREPMSPGTPASSLATCARRSCFPLFTPGHRPARDRAAPRQAGREGCRSAGRRPAVASCRAALIDRRYAPKLADAEPGGIATLTVTVLEHQPPRSPRQPYRVVCADDTGSLALVFFHAKEDYLQRTAAGGRDPGRQRPGRALRRRAADDPSRPCRRPRRSSRHCTRSSRSIR